MAANIWPRLWSFLVRLEIKIQKIQRRLQHLLPCFLQVDSIQSTSTEMIVILSSETIIIYMAPKEPQYVKMEDVFLFFANVPRFLEV